MAKSKIKDIYSGEIIAVWQDEGCVYISFPWVTVSLPNKEWENVKAELKEIIKE